MNKKLCYSRCPCNKNYKCCITYEEQRFLIDNYNVICPFKNEKGITIFNKENKDIIQSLKDFQLSLKVLNKLIE